jgi:hypothetical protein
MNTVNTSDLEAHLLAAYKVRIMGLRAWLENITHMDYHGNRPKEQLIAEEGLEVDAELAAIFDHEVSLEAQGSGHAGKEANHGSARPHGANQRTD